MAADNIVGLLAPGVWDTDRAHAFLRSRGGGTKRSTERQLHVLGLLPVALNAGLLRDEAGASPVPSVLQWAEGEARRKRRLVLYAQWAPVPGEPGRLCLHANDARGARYWMGPPASAQGWCVSDLAEAFAQLQAHAGKDLALFPHGPLTTLCREAGDLPGLEMLAYAPVLDLREQVVVHATLRQPLTPHLAQLEAESIHILREAVAEARNPVMLYSVGKDSGVMLHLARKAFHPAPPPFPLLHVDTRWKFREMYLFRDYMAKASGMRLLVHVNPDAIEKDINPFDHGSALHTDITKTEGLKQALDQHGFDVVFGGARRDEEKSRAKERIFSFRSASHRWDPKNQRPELWNLFNTRKQPGESIRVFPLSNWTELDIWQYIQHERIPVVPLYFAKTRPVLVREDMIMMVDDERARMLPGEEIQARRVRFRTLGCYPLTGAVESDAQSVDDIVMELIHARTSERQGRKIDTDSAGSMEKKKQEGYF